MAQIIHNISTPNDGLGDQLRTAFDNQNIMNTELYAIKVDKVTGKDLSTNDYTNADVTKLISIATGAEVNVQSDWNQSDSGQDDYIKNKPVGLYFTDFYLAEEVSIGLETFDIPAGISVVTVHIERGFRLSTEWSQLGTVLTIPGITTGKRISIFGLQK